MPPEIPIPAFEFIHEFAFKLTDGALIYTLGTSTWAWKEGASILTFGTSIFALTEGPETDNPPVLAEIPGAETEIEGV